MIAPIFLFAVSCLGLAAALFLPAWSEWRLLAGPCVLASLYLLVQAIRNRQPLAPWIMVDGSNVMHWKDGTPQIETLREVVQRLVELGYTPGVVFDANAGYKISGRYQHDGALGRLLGLPESRIMVVGKGTPADPMLLEAARDLGARIVSNDRFRDWAEDHPEVREPGHLIRGGYRDGALWLEVEAVAG